MDTEAQHTERDRSSRPTESEDISDPEGPEDRSRFALVARAADWVPGGRITLTVLVCLLFVVLFSNFVMQPFEIPSSSMERGLRIGDRVLVNKLAYRFGAEPRQGDVVVFDGTGYFGNADYIKRVVGVGRPRGLLRQGREARGERPVGRRVDVCVSGGHPVRRALRRRGARRQPVPPR